MTGWKKLPGYPGDRMVEEDLARFRVSELDLLGRFGPPTHDRDPQLFWDLQWDCGLITAMEMDRLSQVVTLRLDAADVDHALRHLGMPVRDLWLADVDSRGTWEVWKGEDLVASRLTERDARCWCAEADPVSYRCVPGGR